ncbi:MAG: SAVED domain-containing protein [Desulfobaccales bacterium]
MSVSHIPEKIRTRLWVKAGGRCQYEGCNEPLWLDSLTMAEMNAAFVAHIIADKPGGPRGDQNLSEKLKDDITNLMLMCHIHHRLIDVEDVGGHPAQRLREMKKKHEERIELLASIIEEKRSHILLYGANIGEHYSPLSWEKAARAMIPVWYPKEKPAIELGLKNSSFKDNEISYWFFEREHLRRQFNHVVKNRLSLGHIEHLSIFALAPQPLLMELGRLLSDIPAAEVYQLHREPPNWKWQDHHEGFDFTIREPQARHEKVAINLSLSATIDNARITSLLGIDSSIWTMTIDTPDNDFLKSREQLCSFRQKFRKLLDRIKSIHGQDSELNLFPAVPVAVAVDIGRVWMPKADLPIRIYDQNRKTGGFSMTFYISNDESGYYDND